MVITMINTNSHTRTAAVAGIFYASDPEQLSSDILNYLTQAPPSLNLIPKAIIAPHAGYMYSAPVAASAYKLLEPLAHKIKQVVLLGPAHRFSFNGVATPDADYFETPIGTIKINSTLCKQAEQLNYVHPDSLAHKEEHSLEVHLPFLQTLLNDFELTPLLVGNCNHKNISNLLELFWENEETLFVISTDLSHFHTYETAKKQDFLTSGYIETLQPEKINYNDACGRNPLNGLLTLAKKHQLNVKCLDLRNSGDTSGNKDRVVGYGSYVIY